MLTLKLQNQGRSNTTLASDAEELDGNSSRCSTPVDDRGTVRSSSSASNSVTDYDAEGAPKKKKKKVEVDPTFDWKTMINNPDFKAASVGLMKHVIDDDNVFYYYIFCITINNVINGFVNKS